MALDSYLWAVVTPLVFWLAWRLGSSRWHWVANAVGLAVIGAVIAAAMAVTAVLFGIYPFLPTAAAMGLGSILLGGALGCVQPMIMSTLHQITPEARHGEAIALRIMAINASSVAMPILFGVAGAVIGISGVFWVVGLAVGAGTRLAVGLKGDRSP